MILKGTPGPIQIQVFDADTPADPGVTTIGMTRANGTVLVAAGTATSGTGTNPRTYTLTTTHTAQVDTLTATWTTTNHGTLTTYHPIVGAFYVDLNTLRTSGDLADETRFPDQALADVRRWWMDLVDDYCGQSFVPMHRLETTYLARASTGLWLDRPKVRQILSVTNAGTVVSVAGWQATPRGRVYTSTAANPTFTYGTLTVSYEHGHDQPDGELYEAGITAMRDKLLSSRSGRASRQTLITNTLGTVRLAQPGPSRATGIPEVDAVLERRKAHAVMVG